MIGKLLKIAFAKLTMGTVPHPSINNWVRWLLPNTSIDFEQHVGDGQGSNVFMSPLLWLWRASLEARLGLLTENKDEDVLDRDHELVQLLNNPNPFTTGAAMRFAQMVSWFADGNVYLLKARDGAGVPRQLWFVPPWMMEPKSNPSDPTDFISYYCYRPGGSVEINLPPSEVVHLRHGVNPRNVRKGYSLLRLLLREVFNDDEAANFVAALLLNGGVPGIVISPKDINSVGGDDLKATKDYLQSQFGKSKRGAPLVIGSPTDIQEFGYDPNKMNLSVVRNVSEERVCAALGLPAAVVGFGSGMEQTTVGATLQELHRIAWVDCLIPNQELLTEELTREFRKDFKLKPNQRLGWDRDKVRALQEDRNKEAEALSKLVSGSIMMRSEARKRLRLEVAPEDEVYLMPLGVTLEGPGAPEFEPEPTPEPEPEPSDDASSAASKSARRRISREQVKILRAMDLLKVRMTKQFETRLKEFFKRMGKAAAEAYLNSSASKADDDALRVELMMGSFNVNRLRQEAKGLYGSHFVSVHKETLKILAGAGIGINTPDGEELRLLALGGTKAGLLDMIKEARAKALKIISEGRAEGRNPEDIAKDLAEAVPAGRFLDSRTRASVIARTETRFAQTESALSAYRHTQGIDKVMIIDGRLGETDDDCEAANGQVLDFDQAAALLAQEHPNGTRDLVPVFGGE